MPGTEKVFGSLLIIIAVLACSFPCQGCWWEKPKEGPSLVAPNLIKVNVIEEDELEQQLKVVHPCYPSGQAISLSTLCNSTRSRGRSISGTS